MSALLIIVLIVLLLGGIGTAPPVGWVSHSYGYGPSGVLGLLLVVLVIMALIGRSPF